MAFENPIDSTKEYLGLKGDEVKLRLTESLSVVMSQFLSIFVILTVVMIIMTISAFGLMMIFGDLVGNAAAGAFIVAGFFIIVLAVLICLRKKLFLNTFVKLFINMFYGDK